MLVRCRIDGLLLDAIRHPARDTLIAFDGDEPFEMELVEAVHYELVAAMPADLLWLQQAGYRLLRTANDFAFIQRRSGA